MRFADTPIPGAFLIEPEPVTDERGSFTRTFCRDELARRALETAVAQCSVSHNRRRGTLRGLHYQAAPQDEVKLVRCTRGAIFDVIVDLRPGSAAFGTWFGARLDADSGRQLYVPRGVAHGYLTLADDTEVAYSISAPYHAELQRGLRWDDPSVAIAWPGEVIVISERDRGLPGLPAATE